MHINVFGEASFGLRSRKLVNFFRVTLRYAIEQPSSLGCNCVREMSEGFKIEFILCKGDLTMRAKVEKRKRKNLIHHKRMTSQFSISYTQSVLLSLFYDKEYRFLCQWDSIDVSTS